MLVELGVEGEIGVVGLASPPADKSRRFVVDEEAAVLDAGLAVCRRLRESVDLVVLRGWDVGPPVKASPNLARLKFRRVVTYGDCPLCSERV